MRQKLIFLSLIGGFLLMGCATIPNQEMVIVDGSKADGKLTAAGTVNDRMSEIPTDLVDAEALRKCQNWGYSDVEYFATVNTDKPYYDPF